MASDEQQHDRDRAASSSAWEEIGWQGAELVGDEAHGFAYCQRTRDGRIALGGRAVPYRYGSRWDNRGQTMPTTSDQPQAQLARLFPATRAVGIEHAWAGVLGVPRDWCASVGLDRDTGIAWAGGYVGHGVTSTNLAGRTLSDLILQRETDLVTLPWVGHKVRQWRWSRFGGSASVASISPTTRPIAANATVARRRRRPSRP
ncbi:MAG: FAD-dependent oxidoreductase [Nocardioidaceae bacterium]